jgi:hypothetical protein
MRARRRRTDAAGHQRIGHKRELVRSELGSLTAAVGPSRLPLRRAATPDVLLLDASKDQKEKSAFARDRGRPAQSV